MVNRPLQWLVHQTEPKRPLAWHATGHTSWHTTRHSTAWHTACLIHLGDDRSANTLELLLLVLELFLLGRLVAIEPGNGFLALLGDGVDLVGGDFVLHLAM